MPEQGDFRSAITTDSLMHPFRLRRRMLVSCFGPPRIAIPISWSASFRTCSSIELEIRRQRSARPDRSVGQDTAGSVATDVLKSVGSPKPLDVKDVAVNAA